MTKRPLSITIISWIFIAFGGISFLAGLLPLADSAARRIAEQPFEFWLIPLIRILALLCGVFMLYGFDWARWLLVAWVGYHVILGVLHSPFELFMHSLLFAVVLYFVFRPEASAYFRGARVSAATVSKDAKDAKDAKDE
jgi:hypothetical protein